MRGFEIDDGVLLRIFLAMGCAPFHLGRGRGWRHIRRFRALADAGWVIV
ncbi:MAG: hypothetical protein LBS59_01995 [Puniceicoccales bacterium]|nr:hypothetical protein [Puniceicoccales bacterium]